MSENPGRDILFDPEKIQEEFVKWCEKEKEIFPTRQMIVRERDLFWAYTFSAGQHVSRSYMTPWINKEGKLDFKKQDEVSFYYTNSDGWLLERIDLAPSTNRPRQYVAFAKSGLALEFDIKIPKNILSLALNYWRKQNAPFMNMKIAVVDSDKNDHSQTSLLIPGRAVIGTEVEDFERDGLKAECGNEVVHLWYKENSLGALVVPRDQLFFDLRRGLVLETTLKNPLHAPIAFDKKWRNVDLMKEANVHWVAAPEEDS